MYSRRSLQYLLEARGFCSLRRAVAPGGVPGGVCVLPEELAILTGSPGGLFALESCGARRRARRRVCTPRRSLQYLLEARGALFAPESCGARRRARRRVCTPGGACDTYWKPGGLCSLRRAVAPGGVPGGVCVLPEELAILTGSPGGFCSLRRAVAPGGVPGGVCVLPEEHAILTGSPETLFAPESCGARKRVCTPGGACNTYWKPVGLCSLRRAVAPGGVPGGVCVLPEELAILTGSPGGFVRSGELWRPEACVYSRRSLQYLLEARGLCSLRRAVAPGGVPGGVCVLPEELAILTGSPGALFAPESCGARRRARRRVCTPGGACNTYWKPGGLCSLRRAVVPGGVPGGVCVLPEELAILTGSPGGFVRSGELWRPEACPEACVYSRRSLQYLLEAWGALFAPESCSARRRAPRRV